MPLVQAHELLHETLVLLDDRDATGALVCRVRVHHVLLVAAARGRLCARHLHRVRSQLPAREVAHLRQLAKRLVADEHVLILQHDAPAGLQLHGFPALRALLVLDRRGQRVV